MKTFKKVGSLILAGIMVLSMLAIIPFASSAAVTATADWKADADGVFNIGSAADMLAFSANAEANGWYKNKIVKLTADVDMNGVAWTQIEEFQGFFEGMGYAIKNLRLESAEKGLAMIKKLDGATFRNVQFVDAVLVSTAAEYPNAAIIASKTAGECVFENVYVDADLTTATGSKAFVVGGFVAAVETGKMTMTNCLSDVNFLAGWKTFGGFIGTNYFGTETVMTNCVFAGSISASCNVEQAGMVGRVVGNTTLKGCISLGSYGRNSQWNGALVYLDNNDFGSGDTSSLTVLMPIVVNIEDCYVAVAKASDPVIGAHGTRCLYQTTVKYTGDENPVYVSNTSGQTIWNEASPVVKTVAVGDQVTLTKDNLATVLPAIAENFVATDATVKYGTVTTGEGDAAVTTDLTIVKIVPKTINQMLTNTLPTPVLPEMPKDEPTTPPAGDDDQTPPAGDDDQTPPAGDDDQTPPANNETEAKPQETEKKPTTTPEKKGCGASISGGLIALLAAAAALPAVCFKKKED